jgi:hypothetical protein
MPRLVLVALALALAGCASLPEDQLSIADAGRLCARLAEEPGVLQRGAIAHRILDGGAAPAGCISVAQDAAARSDHYRLVDAYETGVRLNQ